MTGFQIWFESVAPGDFAHGGKPFACRRGRNVNA
jgi:hypothetical protein